MTLASKSFKYLKYLQKKTSEWLISIKIQNTINYQVNAK